MWPKRFNIGGCSRSSEAWGPSHMHLRPHSPAVPRSQRTAAPVVKEPISPTRPLHEQRLAPTGLGHFDRQREEAGPGRRTPRLSPPRHQSWPPRQTWQPPHRRVAGGFGGSGLGRCCHQCRSQPSRTCTPPLSATFHRPSAMQHRRLNRSSPIIFALRPASSTLTPLTVPKVGNWSCLHAEGLRALKTRG